MNRTTRCALSLVFTVLGLATTACGAASGGPAASPAPDFSLPALDGKTVRLSDYSGKSVVLIDFWSTTCDPCLAEMPHIVELYKKHRDKGFVVLAVSLDGPESRAQVSSTAHDREMIFPVLLDEETTVAAKYNPKRELPFSVLIGRDGSILHKRGGYQPGDEAMLTEQVEKALGQP
ncbi:TlpA disulfide reductase family protein [Sorangium sp. So ce590]|uniref:peroxiredoxin family protein n=1 Tax=Sorangium sp. So ce590 TaxID=3133317 RepID=UPI003F633527